MTAESSSPLLLEEGKPATVTKSFRAFPRPTVDQVYWVLDTPKGEKVLKPGEEVGRFQALELKDVAGDNRYQMGLVIKKVAEWDKTAKHRLAVDLRGDSLSEPQFVAVNIDVRLEVKEPEEAVTKPPFRPPPPENLQTEIPSKGEGRAATVVPPFEGSDFSQSLQRMPLAPPPPGPTTPAWPRPRVLG
jgi:hypothetical protein